MKKSTTPVLIWLYLGCFLIAAMVVIGGITRLTHSGLSMVEWKLIMGMVPPLNEIEWQEAFAKYKQFPEYQLINNEFSLSEFKSIFWWEFIHRFLGRIIGIVFIVPFAIFIIQKRVSKELMPKLIFILVMGAFQGFLGWFMVKSGLVKDPNVSHYRLAIHLSTAFFLCLYTFWTALTLQFPIKEKLKGNNETINKLLWGVITVSTIQLIYGAFVAGLKAGKFYNTYPLMDGEVVPSAIGVALDRFGLLSLLDNTASVQFIHRIIALLIVVLVVVIYFKTRGVDISIRIAVQMMVLTLFLQFSLGVITLLTAVPVTLGVLHQIGALFFLLTLVNLLHSLREPSPKVV